MKLRIFQAGKGDCLLLTSSDGRSMLVDGGMPDAFAQHLSPALAQMADAGQAIDLVYVSHIDQDHIGGVLKLFDDAVAWRVFDFQQAGGNAGFPKPQRGRPPAVAKVWHNAFAEVVGKNAGAIGDLLAQTAQILSGSPDEDQIELGLAQRELATSVGEAIRLSRRLDPDQLGIPTNPDFGGKLAMVRDAVQAPMLGTIRLTVIGPFPTDLRNLRTDWNTWLKDNKKALAQIAEDAQRDADRLGASELDRVVLPLLGQARALGNRAAVTPPNLASLMLLAEEDGQTLLLTGDGHASDILAGLRAAGKLVPGSGMHVNVLKVQHHGSENNIDDAFCRTITADDYVFCGNGEHLNPDLEVLRAIVRSRLGTNAERSKNAETRQRFRFWFNSSHGETTKAEAVAHMQAIEALVAQQVAQSNGAMTAQFLAGASSFEVPIGP